MQSLVRNASLADQVLDILVERIRSREYPPQSQLPPENDPVIRRFGEQDRGRRFEPGIHLLDRLLHRAGGRVDPRVGHHREELVHARPGECPCRLPLRHLPDRLPGTVVEGRIATMGVDEQVRIDRDHDPRPS